MKKQTIKILSLLCFIALAASCSDDNPYGNLTEKDKTEQGDDAGETSDGTEPDSEDGEDTGTKKREVTDPQTVLKQPNSFILSPGGSIEIPVAKPFAVWTERKSDFGKADLSGDMQASIVWEHPDGLVDIGELKVVGDDVNSACIEVVTKAGVEGNALVALKVGGDVRWSWHLWVSGYDPDTETGGVTYTYNNGTGDYTLMDRNLGAMKAEAIYGPATWGLYYQWGRKDPIIADSYKNVIPDEPPTNNLAEATMNPGIFFVSNGLGDWYSYRSQQDHDLWGSESRKKSIFDPCPEGWMVPLFNRKLGDGGSWGYVNQNEYGFNGSPWHGLQHYQENDYKFARVGGEYPGCTSPVVGFYPAQGYLTSNSGEHHWGYAVMPGTTSEEYKWGYYWTSESWTTTNPYDALMMLQDRKGEIYPGNSWSRGVGMPVRCVKQNGN